MARLVVGDREVMSQMLFGPPSIALQNYIQTTNNYFSNNLTTVGQELVQSANNMFARLETSEAAKIAKAALRAVNVYFQNDVISQMYTVSDLQEAPDCMLRWIMAHPTLQEYYHDNRIDGYGNRYQPQYAFNEGTVGWLNPDYVTVQQGWIEPVIETRTIKDESGEEIEIEETYDEFTWVLTDEDEPEELLDVEAAIVRSAYELVDIAIQNNQDPTSYYDSQIVS